MGRLTSHRVAVFVTGVFLLVAGTAVGAVGASGPAAARPSARAATTLHPGAVWTLSTGILSTCQSDTFSTHHIFAAALTEGTGDNGTYRSSHSRGRTLLVMTWTGGTDKGAVFDATFHRATGAYVGSYQAPGTSAAEAVLASLVPSTHGCPLITTAAGQATVLLGTSDTDTATLTGAGGLAPTGAVDFFVCPGPTQPCTSTTSGAVSLGAVNLTGTGGSATATSPAYTAGAVGHYCFGASYAGDSNYAPALDTTGAGECFSVTPGTTGFGATVSVASTAVGNSVTDTATLTVPAGGAIPTGAVTFDVCGPSTSLAAVACTPAAGTELGTPIGVSASSSDPGTYTATSYAFTPPSVGTYCLVASYPGDGNYAPATDATTARQCVQVTDPGAITTAPMSTTIPLGATDSDVATVTGTGGVTPTGTVHFYVCVAASDPCITAAYGIVDLGTVALAQPGAAGTATAVSPRYTPPATGSYCFLGVYSGDTNYLSASDGSLTDECFTVDAAQSGAPIGLLALNKVGPHEVLASGSGQFVVAGDITLNTDVQFQPWSAFADGYEFDDAIDARNGSSLYVYGTIHAIGNETINNMAMPLWPLDTCFDTLGIVGAGTNESPAYQTGDPTLQAPANQLSCHNGAVNLDYDSIDTTGIQIDDPLATASKPPPNPLSASTNITCPGQPANVVTSVPAGGFTSLRPGDYQIPVEITGSAVFNDCPGGYTGLYRFEQGLWINPQAAGDTVTGSNVVIGTENPYPMAGNVPGSMDTTTGAFDASGAGNGAPCLPSITMTSAASGNGTPMAETSGNQCGGTTDDGVIGYFDNATTTPDTSETGTGSNFSAIIGGVTGTSVTLTGPTDGIYAGDNGGPGLVLYQDPTVQANDGFDAEAGDAADIQINGVVYNNSLTDYGADAPQDFWDGTGGGIPFYAGGTLQAGYGTGWIDGPVQSSGSVTLVGTAVTDDFDTGGSTDMTVIEKPYMLPSAGRRRALGHRSTVRVRRTEAKRSARSPDPRLGDDTRVVP